MDREQSHILICFWCQRRITVEELRAGEHNHIDNPKRTEFDPAVNNGID